MEQPLGFAAQGESSFVCMFHLSLYELNQSPRAWFDKFSHIVRQFGLKRSETSQFFIVVVLLENVFT